MAEPVEVIEDVVEEAVEAFSDGRYIRGRFVVLSSVLSAVAGAAVSAYFTDRRLRKQYGKIAEDEIDQMREHFRARLVSRETKPDLGELSTKVKDLGYDSNSDIPAAPGEPNTPDVPKEVRNVFEEQKVEDEWDYEVELRSRTEDRPYIIHVDEKAEKDYDEITLTYYAGDDVLCNSEDVIMDDQDRLVGLAHLDKFGHGSNDPSIVYIRNDELTLDIEVIRSNGTYAEEVHGFKHEDPPRRRRSRQDE